MSSYPVIMVDGIGLTNSLADMYTVPDNTIGKLGVLVLSNSHTSAVLVDLYAVPTGGGDTYDNQIFIGDATNGLTLAPKETKIIPLDMLVSAGTKIRAKASVTTVVGMRLDGFEIVGS